MKVGFYSPLPPAHTGVAEYAEALLDALGKLCEVRVNQPGDVQLYQIGNNHLHREIYTRALAEPGVVVIHDAVLHHFLLGTLSREAYVDEFIFNYGAPHREQAERLWEARARSGVDPEYFRYPMLKRLVEAARAVIVHNPAAARIAREHGARRVVEVPHLFAAPGEIGNIRASLNLRANQFLFGVFGHLRESKRLTSVLRAFETLDERAVLLIAGEFASSDLARAMEPVLARERVIRVGYTPEDQFWSYAAAVDACINLRYPTAGETSGIAVRLMGIGKPVLLTESEEVSRLPPGTSIRIDAGPLETAMLSEYMSWLIESPENARAIGALAARHIAEHHDLGKVAEAYRRVLCEA